MLYPVDTTTSRELTEIGGKRGEGEEVWKKEIGSEMTIGEAGSGYRRVQLRCGANYMQRHTCRGLVTPGVDQGPVAQGKLLLCFFYFKMMPNQCQIWDKKDYISRQYTRICGEGEWKPILGGGSTHPTELGGSSVFDLAGIIEAGYIRSSLVVIRSRVDVGTEGEFGGVIYTRGSYHKREHPCFLDPRTGRDFSLRFPLDQCHHQACESGWFGWCREDDVYSNVVVIQHDDELIMPGDAAFTLECDFSKPRDFTVNANLAADSVAGGGTSLLSHDYVFLETALTTPDENFSSTPSTTPILSTVPARVPPPSPQ
uniref:Uncharacterized protein n=1 Tax=Timema tahoe TaxID=61484 RepID=A0A7R9ILG5_9NEOP|nr:unnamed protein product [Timema tahoe]